ncbi:hypothetical protein EDC01DRAFT_786110 [Geopyxis carbonaria]|nr:hypothetical protein EDC01DRAFT_786110 [Geopyxis carbonaria]
MPAFTFEMPTIDVEAQTLEFLGHVYPMKGIMRMIVILFGYLLIRPMLLKLSGKAQSADHAREMRADEADSMAATGKVAPGGEIDESSDEEEGGWGKSVRRRERAARLMEQQRQQREEEEEDEELKAMLED